MSKFCETSRQLCLLLLIVVVRGGCNTQSHSMSNNNNEYEWVSWLHVTFGNANIQPAKQGRTETKKRRWKSQSKIRILLSYVKKKGARCRKRRNAFFFTSLQSLRLLVYIHKCLLFNFLGCFLSNEKKWKRFFSRDFLNV